MVGLEEVAPFQGIFVSFQACIYLQIYRNIIDIQTKIYTVHLPMDSIYPQKGCLVGHIYDMGYPVPREKPIKKDAFFPAMSRDQSFGHLQYIGDYNTQPYRDFSIA